MAKDEKMLAYFVKGSLEYFFPPISLRMPENLENDLVLGGKNKTFS